MKCLLNGSEDLEGQGWEIVGRIGGVGIDRCHIPNVGYCYSLTASPSTALRLSRQFDHDLPLSKCVLVVQVYLMENAEFSFQIETELNTLLFATYLKQFSNDGSSARLPLQLDRNKWHNLIVPLYDICNEIWPGGSNNRPHHHHHQQRNHHHLSEKIIQLKSMIITANSIIKRVFTIPYSSNQSAGVWDVPTSMDLRSVGIRNEVLCVPSSAVAAAIGQQYGGERSRLMGRRVVSAKRRSNNHHNHQHQINNNPFKSSAVQQQQQPINRSHFLPSTTNTIPLMTPKNTNMHQSTNHHSSYHQQINNHHNHPSTTSSNHSSSSLQSSLHQLPKLPGRRGSIGTSTSGMNVGGGRAFPVAERAATVPWIQRQIHQHHPQPIPHATPTPPTQPTPNGYHQQHVWRRHRIPSLSSSVSSHLHQVPTSSSTKSSTEDTDKYHSSPSIDKPTHAADFPIRNNNQNDLILESFVSGFKIPLQHSAVSKTHSHSSSSSPSEHNNVSTSGSPYHSITEPLPHSATSLPFTASKKYDEKKTNSGSGSNELERVLAERLAETLNGPDEFIRPNDTLDHNNDDSESDDDDEIRDASSLSKQKQTTVSAAFGSNNQLESLKSIVEEMETIVQQPLEPTINKIVKEDEGKSGELTAAIQGFTLDEDEAAILASMKRSHFRNLAQTESQEGQTNGIDMSHLKKHEYEDEEEDEDAQYRAESAKDLAYGQSQPGMDMNLLSMESSLNDGNFSFRLDSGQTAERERDSGVEEGEMDLIYDPQLNCYFNPITKVYYRVAS